MISEENSESVKQLYQKLEDRYNQFKSVHTQCLELCDDSEEADILRTSYNSHEQNFKEFSERYLEWKRHINVDHEDTVSVISSAYSNSSQTQRRRAKAKRLVAENRLRLLQEKQRLEREERELENQQREIENKRQILVQQSEIEEAKIEESVWEDDSGENKDDSLEIANVESACGDRGRKQRNGNGVCDEHSIPRDENISRNARRTTDRDSCDISDRKQTTSAEDVSMTTESRMQNNSGNHDNSNGKTETLSSLIPGTCTSDTALYRLANIMQEGFNLPKPELLTFGGSAIDYCKFIKNFETNVETKVSDNRLRLSYLIQYCEGEAKACIEDCVLLDADKGYKRAREILQSRYGRPHVIARTYIDRLLNGPQIKASDVDKLSGLALDMQRCQMTLSQLGFESDVDNTENLRRIARRLPMHLRSKWADVAHFICESGREPRFSDLAEFVDKRSQVASSVYGIEMLKESTASKVHDSKQSNGQSGSSHRSKVTTLSTSSRNTKQNCNKYCSACLGACADLGSCQSFQGMKLADRRDHVYKHKLCFNCLKGNHFSRECRKPKQCNVADCSGKHHPLLHSWVQSRLDHTATQPSVNCASTKGAKMKNCLGIIPVIVKGENGSSCHTYALLDDGADKTLCDERLLKKIQVESKPVTYNISTVSSSGSLNHGQEVNLLVQAKNGGGKVNLRRVWSVKKLPISTKSAAKPEDIKKLPYLADLAVPKIDTSDVMLLIGTDSPDAHIPLEVRSGESQQPYAVRTRLGWSVRGPVEDNCESDTANVHFQKSSDVLLQQQLERMWNADFDDKVRKEKMAFSVEDKRALASMESSTTHENGRYKLGLPWREGDCTLPNNLPLAHTRLNQLKRKLSKDPNLKQMYTATMNDYLEKGYAVEVSNPDKATQRTWYLPHHPVTNVNKPGKVRVVFDCAAKYKGVSLNSKLLQGPDLTNNLVGVILRFRQEKVAIAADIEAMFHQVRVKDDDCNALRFLWWPNGDLDQQPKIYCMQVHLFGATSSPSCAAYALKRTGRDNSRVFDSEVVATVDKNFYVDDCLKSVHSEERAIQMVSELRSLLSLGGFRLTKWLSNNRAVLNSIPETERAPSVINLEPDDALPCERALGTIWDVNDDKIKFKVKIAEKPVTRRGVLSIVSAIFDPLGFVSPVTLKAKTIIQRTFREKLGWDDPLPYEMRNEWQNWLETLKSLEKVSIDRCFKSECLGEIRDVQLHIFSDASELGYGACAYMRLTDTDNRTTCSFLIGKSRLAPMKQMTIPRLELSAAVVACRLYAFLAEELDMKIDSVTFWTDSAIVLGYIRNESRRFKTFVANRLSEIHDTTTPEQWRHVDTCLNPADIAFSGIEACDTQKFDKWFNGPDFLWQSPDKWPKQFIQTEVTETDLEVKRETRVHATTSDIVENIVGYFSSWTKLVQAVAWLLRFKDYFKERFLANSDKCSKGRLSVTELRRAESAILAHVQGSYFHDELAVLQKGKPVNRNSRLSNLNPVIHDNMIKLNGRTNYTDGTKWLVILPNNHHVTKLIIRHYHETYGHVGTQQVLAATREKYWIVKGPSTVKRTIKECFLCRRQSGQPCKQQMAPLLQEQTTPNKPPFSFVGVDFFGPLIVKVGRSHVKRYGCLFTCLTTRAVHIEIAHSLDTDSFIAAFQRFTSRRGHPEKVFSDNGTNLVAGDRALRESMQQWNQSKIEKHMKWREIEWHFNPPYSSHMGGTWERMIRSTRTILKAIVQEQLLTDEKLLTLMAETERIMNDRPITKLSDDPKDLPALTPNMLLLMRPCQSLPVGVFKKEDSYARRWWKQMQYLANIFWRRWIKEYLATLQPRQKWQRQAINLKVGDLVLEAQENVPRGQWPLARVVDVNVGRDGLVRSCVIKTRTGNVLRPIRKLCLLEGSN